MGVLLRRRWVGRWIATVGVVHCLVGLMVFFKPLTEILGAGLWNAVDGFAGRPLAFWFEFAGLLSIVFGLAVDRIEKERIHFPAAVGYGFFALTALAIVAMPFSGGWLLLPAAIGLLLKKRNKHLWAPIAANLAVGVSLGLPLFLYMREQQLARSAGAGARSAVFQG